MTASGKTRRPRDPRATREAILEAALARLAADGPEGLSLSEVAHLAGVNRGTAYQHFETREKLVKATTDWASAKIYRAVFGDPAEIGERRIEQIDVPQMTDRLSAFAMDNPELCRVWLMQVLASPDPASDPFWREYEGSTERFALTDFAVPGVDVEVLSVIMLAGAFFWPIWAQSQGRGQDRAALSRRFSDEMLRLSMFGSLRVGRFPQIAARLHPTPAPDSSLDSSGD